MTTITTNRTTDLEEFYTELLRNSILQERLKAATSPESLSELVVELGKEKGYFFSKQEVLAAMAIEASMGGEYVEIPLSGAMTPRLEVCAPIVDSRCSSPLPGDY